MNTPFIIYEDDHYVAAHKPAWWLTHPSNEARHIKENLMAFVRNKINKYVYPVNRLDLQSSGIVLFGKDKESVAMIQKDWSSEKTIKKYFALVHGHVDEQGLFDFDLHDENKVPKKSLTLYKTLKYYEDATFVDVEIKTGRRHQIRRHFSRRMHALIGDRKYGKKKWNDPYKELFGLNRLFLHSYYLKFVNPYNQELIEVIDSLPADLENVLEQLVAKIS